MNIEIFDYETFIGLVKDRDVLWDKTLDTFKDKRKTWKAWFEICHIMNEDFAELPDTEKYKYGKMLSQKWKNIRDTWLKCDKKMRESKSEPGAKPVHKYQYYDSLHFLQKNTSGPLQSGVNIPEEIQSQVTNVKKRKKTEEINSVDKKMKKLEKDDDSRMMSFFKGIAPSVERFKEEDIVEFQYQVLNIIRNIQHRNSYSAPHLLHTADPLDTPTHYIYNAGAGPSTRVPSEASNYSIENDCNEDNKSIDLKLM